jgi:Tol biopolymer transport system component
MRALNQHSKLALVLLVSMLVGCLVNHSDNQQYVGLMPVVNTLDTEPDFSPDGSTIAYTHLAQDSTELQSGPSQIWILDLRTMSKQFLVQGHCPRWSPDASKIAYVSNNNVYVIDIQTKESKQLTSWGDCYFPSWSPTGSQIAFDASTPGSASGSVIWLMNSDGTNKRDISQHGVGEWRQPRWSPDGDRILHLRYVGVGFPELFLMDTSGANSVRLTNNNFDDRDPT